MSFDGIVIRTVTHELKSILPGGRITKIYQPSNQEIILHIRSQGTNHALLLSAHPTYASFYLTHQRRENPKHPPTFCMLLRKHLENGVIDSIEQIGMERIVHLNYRTRDELGDEVTRRIVIELMGRHSNLILLDPKTNTILDSIRRVSASMSQHRTVLPGGKYISPPDQGKLNPLDVRQEKFIAGFDYNRGQLDKQLLARFSGISPLIAKEIIVRAGIGSREQLWDAFHTLMEELRSHHYRPTIVKNNTKEIFSAIPLSHVQGEAEFYPSMSACLDRYFYGKMERDHVRGQTLDLSKRLKNEKSKNDKKIAILSQEIACVSDAEQHRIHGELLTAHLHQVKRGDRSLQVTNYYDPNSPQIHIVLDPMLSPSQNAQRYFKKYQKLKSSKKWNEEQIMNAHAENHYLESILVQLEQSSVSEVEQIREELQEEGWIKRRDRSIKKKKTSVPKPTEIRSSEGFQILIGKNNKQNDYLTHRIASPNDTWLHTKDIPGSHVVIRGKNITESALLEAAMLAAYFSKARQSSQVPVDYTLVKHVKKPAGARPGFVIYDHQQTLYVTPDEDQIRPKY